MPAAGDDGSNQSTKKTGGGYLVKSNDDEVRKQETKGRVVDTEESHRNKYQAVLVFVPL